MGICGSSLTDEEKAAVDASRAIDNGNHGDWNHEQEKIKLLLLGAGESGKSTIFKQMKILYGSGFSEEDRDYFKRHVYSNTIEAIQRICQACQFFGREDELAADSRSAFDAVLDLNNYQNTEIAEEVGGWIKTLWADAIIQETWERRSEYQVIETTKSFFQDIDRIAAFDFLPTVEDVLLTRVRTSGIVEDKYSIDGTEFVMFDVGGQRNERKKWIHCFDDVSAVIFVAALSEYDQVLFEDDTTNRMMEAINLFDSICNSQWFTSTSMILFLNKRDLFVDKVELVNIGDIEHFSDYASLKYTPLNYDHGVAYFLSKFLDVNQSKSKDIFHHVTSATDTTNVETVFNACKEIILKGNLEENGFVN